MPFLSALGSATLFGFGNAFPSQVSDDSNQPYNGTMYYYEETEETTSTWATLSKWYKNSNHTQSASALPTASNATVLLNNTSADLETWTAPASINISGHTLILNAHPQASDCAAAKEFGVLVTANSSSQLVLTGHINITGVNHTKYFIDNIDYETKYYYDSDIAVNSYIYVNQFSDTVATVARNFLVELEENGSLVHYDVSTNSTGKVTSKTAITTPPTTNTGLETLFGKASFSSKYVGYAILPTVKSCDDSVGLPSSPNLKVFLNASQFNQGELSAYPEWAVAYKAAELIEGEWVYEKPGVVYVGDFLNTVNIGGNQQFMKYTTNGAGLKAGSTLCS